MSETIFQKKYLIPILIFIFGLACFANPPTTVESVDLNKYQGKWYEISRLPNKFQADCISDVFAEYLLLDSNEVQVLNSCTRKSGKSEATEGRARVVDSSNSKLKVAFAKIPFTDKFIFKILLYDISGDYWISYLDPDYQMVIITNPKRTVGWVLARSPLLSAEQTQTANMILSQQGYDPCKFVTTLQSQGLDKAVPFCNL